MPSAKKRINLTVDDDMYQLLTDICDLQGGIPKATLVNNYLEMLRPNMVEIRDVMRMVKEQDPSPYILKMLSNNRQDLLNILKEELKDD